MPDGTGAHVGTSRDPTGMHNCTHLPPLGKESLWPQQVQGGPCGSGVSELKLKRKPPFLSSQGGSLQTPSADSCGSGAVSASRWERKSPTLCASVFSLLKETHSAMLDPGW